MALTRKQKQKIIDDLKEKIIHQKAMVFVAIEGLKAKELFDLRRELKEKDCLLKVAKKTLTAKIFKENKIDCDLKVMEGQLGLVFGFENPLSPAKVSYNFSKKNEKLKILGGFFENNFINKKEVIGLATIPSKEELLGRITGSLKAPVANFVNVLQGNIKGLLYILTKVKT